MKISKLFLLVIAAAVLVGLALWSGKSKRPRAPEQVGKAVLPGLNVNAISRIEIAKGGKSVTLANNGDAWVVQSLFNYPADFSKIRENLLALHDLKVGAVQRSAKIDDDATLVDLQDASGKSIASLRLGAVRQNSNNEYGYSMPDGRSVAANNDDTVFLVKESLNNFEPDAKSWINSEIANLQAADIATIAYGASDGEFILDRTSGKLTLADLGEGEAFDSGKSYGAESALSYLRFNNLSDPALDDATTGIATGRTYTVTTKDGTIYTAKIGNAVESDRYLRLSIAAQPVSTNAAERAEVAKKALDQNARVSPWLYLISSYTADNMTRSRDYFIKPATPAKTESEPVTLNTDEDETTEPAKTEESVADTTPEET